MISFMKWILKVLGFLLAGSALAATDENWPRFRGPTGQGQALSTNLPLTWSEQENVRWKTPIHGKGWSSPVIWGRQVWLTTATEDGRQLFAVCVDRDEGKVIHDLKLFDIAKPQYVHPFNSYASPTPAIEEGRVYVTFGSPGTACLDTRTGKVLWKREDMVCNHFRGAGSSPLLLSDQVVMHFDGSDVQYVAGLDKRTGQTLWKTPRSVDFKDLGENGQPKDGGDFRKAFSTPLMAVFNQQPMLLSLGSKALYGYRVTDGGEFWRVEMPECHSGSATPVTSSNVIYYCAGFPRGELLALEVTVEGRAIQLELLWKTTKDVPMKPSPLLVNNALFLIDDSGVASCLDAKAGDLYWREKIGGHYSASPLYAPGRVYGFSEEGKTIVFQASPEFKALATNELADGFMASPAASADALYLRTKNCLYRIEKTVGKTGSN
jgi:outer membrane protein assembly factor BamB